ncbi:hypothetical protein [Gordonia metallireducens]|uniref:hypothetical protein n=1 Tax=Gordonia metallireducens TaxID=2897779 RepID=UPI001E422739|nr:hypothetical protein [Gordonia metallireducens]
MRYVDLDAHADAGLGLDEFEGPARFTRPSERIIPRPVNGAQIPGDGRPSGADVIRAEALASLEGRIAHAWSVWEGLTEGQSRDNLARFIHDLEDRADALTEDLDRGNTTPPKTSPAKNRVVEGESTTQKEK